MELVLMILLTCSFFLKCILLIIERLNTKKILIIITVEYTMISIYTILNLWKL